MSPHPAELARMRAEVAALSDAVTARFNGLLASHRTQGGVLPAGLATAAAEIRRVHGEVGRFLAAPQVDPDGDARVMTTLIDVQRRTLALLSEIERSTTGGGPAPRAAPPQPPTPAAPAPQTARPPLLPWQQEPLAAPPPHPAPTQPRTPQSQRPQAPQFDAHPQGQPGTLPAGYHQAASPQAPLAPQTQGRPAQQFQAVAPAADPRTVDPRAGDPRTGAPRTAPPAPQTRPTVPPQQRPAQQHQQPQQTGVPPTGWPTAPQQQPRAEPQPFRAGPGQQGMGQQPYPAAPQHQVGQHQGGQPYAHGGVPGGQPSPAYAQQMQPQAAPPAFDPVRAGYGNLVNAQAHDDDAHHEETSAPPSRRLSRRTWILSATAVLAIVAITGVYLAGPRLGRVVALVRGTQSAIKPVTKSADAGKKSGAIPAVAKADATASGRGDAFIPVLATYADYSAARQAFVALKQRYPDLLGGTAPDIETVTVPDGGTWHRLGVLPALPRAQAQDLCQQLQTAGHTGCWVRPQG